MRNYVFSTKVTSILAFVSLAAVIVIHYFVHDGEVQFWENVMLAIFGSSFLTAITSCIGYHTEKRRTMEAFFCNTNHLLNELRKYGFDWDDSIKIDFIMKYNEIDKEQWGEQFGSIHFMFKYKKKIRYIYQKIYLPLNKLNCLISSDSNQSIYRLYRGGKPISSAELSKVIGEFESRLILKETYMCGETKITCNKLILDNSIRRELNGHYYDLMYSKNTQKGCDVDEQSKD